METHLMKRPGAWLPMGMSVLALALVLGHAAMYGVAHEPDEGTPAHLFQLLMVMQLPLIALFAWRWLREQPQRALAILAVQAALIVAAVVSVIYLT